MLMYMISET